MVTSFLLFYEIVLFFKQMQGRPKAPLRCKLRHENARKPKIRKLENIVDVYA